MSKHTPAPWVIDGDQINGADGAPICETVIAMNAEQAAILAADARLMAAAPEMAAEMRRYLPIIDAIEKDPALWWRLTAGTGIATANGYRAALAKAEGL